MKKFSNPARVRQEILASARPRPMYETWEAVPLRLRLLMLEHITLLIAEVMREPQSQMKLFRVKVEWGVYVENMRVSARNSDEAMSQALLVLGKDFSNVERIIVEGTVVPA